MVLVVLVVQKIILSILAVQIKKTMLNSAPPLTPIIETFRAGFLGDGDASWARLGYSAIFMLVVVFVGVVIFNRVEKTFIDTV